MNETYKKRAAVIEAYRRGRFFWRDTEDSPSHYENFLATGDLMEGRLSLHMQQAFARFGERMETPTFPLIATLALHKAVAFREGMTVELVDAETGEALTGAEAPVVRHLARLLEDSGIEGAFAEADSYLVSHRSAGVWVRFRPSANGQPRGVSVTVLPPYCLDLDTHPRHPEVISGITVPAAGDQIEAKNGERCVYQELATGEIVAGIVDAKGDPIDEYLPEAPQGTLTVPAFPVMLWTENDQRPLPALPKSQLDYQDDVNLLLAEVRLGFRIGAHGRPYLRKQAGAQMFPAEVARTLTGGCGSTGENITVTNTQVRLGGGPESVPIIPDGYELAQLDSTVDPIAFLKYAEAHIKMAYAAEEMVVSRIDLFNPQPHNYSGRAKMIDASPLEDARQRRERRLSRLAENTLELWAAYHNLANRRPDLAIPERARFRVRFPGMWHPATLLDQSAMQGAEIASRLGLLDLPATLACMMGISRTEARRRISEAAGFTGRVSGFAQPRAPGEE